MDKTNNKPNLDQLIGVTLTRRQWTVIYNVLTNVKYGLGDARWVLEICDKIEPNVAMAPRPPDAPKPPEKPAEGVVITKKIN